MVAATTNYTKNGTALPSSYSYKMARTRYKNAYWNLYQNLTQEKCETKSVRTNAKTIKILDVSNKSIYRRRKQLQIPSGGQNFNDHTTRHLLQDATYKDTQPMQIPLNTTNNKQYSTNTTEHNKQQAIFQTESLNCKRPSWKDENGILQHKKKDLTKLYKLTKQLNEETAS